MSFLHGQLSPISKPTARFRILHEDINPVLSIVLVAKRGCHGFATVIFFFYLTANFFLPGLIGEFFLNICKLVHNLEIHPNLPSPYLEQWLIF